jgi:hypothetical protein
MMQDKPVSCAVTCVFHQVMKIHLQRNNLYLEAEKSNKPIVCCVCLSAFCTKVVGDLTK